MKILFVISNLANGGAERVLSVLCDEFSKMGDTCEILYFEENSQYYDFKATLTHLPLYENSRILSKFTKFFKIRKAIKKSGADAIISLLDQTNINTIISTLFMKRKLIITEHTEQSALKSGFWRFVRNKLYPLASALVVLNKFEKKYYNFVKNVKVIYNPLNQEFLSDKKSLNKENIVLCVGRLEKVKNYEFYLKSLALLPRDLLTLWRFIIAGDGSQKERLENLADELGLKIEFLGHVKDAAELYAKSKILALPSKKECFGNVLIESICYHCARIATETSGAKELIIHAKDGIIASEVEFSQSLKTLMENENLQKTLANNALLRLGDFDGAKIAKQYKELIDSVEF